MRRATLSTLRRAEELRLHSLALPAFGTGVGRMDPKESAEAMIGALRTHLSEVSASSLRRIHLVLFQDETYQAFGTLLGFTSGRRAGSASSRAAAGCRGAGSAGSIGSSRLEGSAAGAGLGLTRTSTRLQRMQ